MSSTPMRRKSRDRHGRGMRWLLAPRGSRTQASRAQEFADVVEAATARLAKGWSEQLRLVQIEIREVPERQLAEDLEISLGSHMAGTVATPARVTLYRRPITLRAPEVRERRDLVRDVLAEQLGHIWSMSARDIDPSYAGPDIY